MLAAVQSRAATIDDVAKAAGVSPATVSRVVNGTRDVSPDRAARVRAAVAELGYQPFGPARALRRQATDVWAVIVADIENPFFTSIVRGIEDGGREHGFRVMLCNSDEDLRKEADYVDVAIAERMAGVVIAVASTRASKLDPLLDAGIAVVAVDRRPGGTQGRQRARRQRARGGGSDDPSHRSRRDPHRLHHRTATTQHCERAGERLPQGTPTRGSHRRSLARRSSRTSARPAGTRRCASCAHCRSHLTQCSSPTTS